MININRIYWKNVCTLLLITAVILSFIACNDNESTNNRLHYNELTHKSNDIIQGNFKLLTTETDHAIYYFTSGTSEEKATSCVNQMEESITKLHQLILKNDKKINIYILENKLILEAYNVEDNLVMNLDTFENKEYFPALVSSYYGCKEAWISYGISELMINNSIDKSSLTAYYSMDGSMNTLGLFGGRFLEFFCSNEEVDRAKNTAASLVDYIINTYGPEELLHLLQNPLKEKEVLGIDYITLKNDWLSSINVNKTYQYPYEGEFIGLQFTSSNKYPVIIKTDSMTYNFPEDSKSIGIIESGIDEIEAFFHYALDGQERLEEYLDDNVQNANNDIDLSQKITCIFTSKVSMSFADARTGTVSFIGDNAYLHELVHLYIPIRDEKNIWIYEGISEYLGRIIISDLWRYYVHYNWQESLSTPKDSDDIYSESIKKFKSVYEAKGGSLRSMDLISPRLYYDIESLLTITGEGKYNSGAPTMGEAYPNIQLKQGKDLTYPQSGSLVAYLVDQYSLDDVIAVCGDYASFEETFGKTFDQIVDEWTVFLKEHYDYK